MASEEIVEATFPVRLAKSFGRIYSSYIDRTATYIKGRWLFFFAMVALFVLRIYLTQGFYIVTYGLGIYLLNLLIGFLSPQVDPETEGPVLPVRDAEEYRPFQRRLPEFKCWQSATRAVVISITMTFFRMFDLPVFWPILLMYFLVLFVLTMKQQIRHMIKYRYVPWSWGKARYASSYGDVPLHSK
ncbi:unnamed protein product [Vitrella brassicaformis CCMP3155]|uniref:Protein RER1 n=1 Tax=Vitrella brassicaformis (strain CCMP3155) TaxID=1169540 RepID=A0A0G4H715_VITBC|nr:unnamed protein product [Vitrella brassicaformis CCMP3155]|eukprot:CEM39496.1 unnamed protein product [Vitrella brassicaformis CCMP3155]